ncbi:hypothetical protein [Chryseobacterium bernardetii]|uniref:hypothetical protein n=1 Tax=Chryseobacterium bernardetii TaxID=1241978 RepID=UPI003019FF23
MKKILLFCILLLTSIANAQVLSMNIDNLAVNNQSTSVTTPIKMDDMGSVNLKFNVIFSAITGLKAGPYWFEIRLYKGNGNYKVLKDITYSNILDGFISFDVNVDSFDLNYSYKNYLVAFLKSQPYGQEWYSNTIIFHKKPTFSLSPQKTYIDCSSPSPVTFSCTSNTNEGSFSYNWNIGAGWNLNGVPTLGNIVAGSTLTLTPTTPGVLPGQVKVTPVWEGVSQGTLSASTAFSGINPSIAITGSTNVCSFPSNVTYTINSPTITNTTWGSSDPSIAEIISSSATSTNLSIKKQGLFTLTATVSNSCGQTKTLSKKIYVGTPSYTFKTDPNNTNYVTYYAISNNPDISLEDQGINPNNFIWKKLDDGSTQTGFSYSANGFGYDWSFLVETSAITDCGIIKNLVTIQPPAPRTCDRYSIAKSGNSEFIYYIEIDPCGPPPAAANRIAPSSKKTENLKLIVVDARGITIINTNSLSFDLTQQLPGTYYATIIKDGKIVHKQTLLKH